MLTANRISDPGFRKDVRLTSSGVLGPQQELKWGDRLIATTTQKPFLNQHTLAFAGKRWTFKATNLLAAKFALFENETEIGTVSSGSFFSCVKRITSDLPDELPREVHMFLLSILISKLMAPS